MRLVTIGQVKRDISDLVNRVAYAGERIVLTSRGRPKAVLISITDFERLQEAEQASPVAEWQVWLDKNQQLRSDIMAERQGEPFDVDTLWQEMREDLETRHDFLHHD